MFQVRKAVLGDAESVARVHVDSWKATYSELINEEDLTNITFENRKTLWETILKMPGAGQVALVIHNDDGEIVGFVSGGKERTKRFGYDGEIYAIYLLNKYQRQGLGTSLLKAFFAEMKKAGYRSLLVWVLTQNPSSQFYVRYGALPVEEEKTTIGEGTYQETAFGWKSVDEVIEKFTR